MRLFCPVCKEQFEAAALNVAANVAFCQTCNEAFEIGDLVRRGYDDKVNLLEPPPGVWFEDTRNGWTLGARVVMPTWIYGAVGFAAGIPALQLPAILAADPSAWIVIPLFAVLLAFLILGITYSVLYHYAGLRFLCNNGAGVIRTGFIPLEWNRRFAWKDVLRVEEHGARTPHRGNHQLHTYSIAIVTRFHTYETGSWLNDHQRTFIISALQQLLEESQSQDGVKV